MKHTEFHKPHLGILFMLGAAFFFSIMGALVKEIANSLPSTQIVFLRAITSCLLLLPYAFYKKIPLIAKNKKLVIIRSLSGFIALCLNFYILAHLELADASLFNRSSVFFVAILSVLILKEKITKELMVLMMISFLGIILILKPSLNVVNLPGLAGIGVGVLAAIAYVSIKLLHDTENFLTIVVDTAIISTILSFVLFGRDFIIPTSYQLVVCLIMGISGTIAQIMLTLAYKYDHASIVTPYSFVMVLFASVWGFLFFNEIPDPLSIIGGIFLISASIGILRLSRTGHS